MTKTTKRLLSIAAAIAVSGAFATVNAEYNPVNTNNVPTVSENFLITINDLPIENTYIYNIYNNGIIMLPLREIAENLGYTVSWNDADSSVTLSRYDADISLKIDKNEYILNGKTINLEAAPMLINDDTTYVPSSFVDSVINGRITKNENGSLNIIELRTVKVTEILEDKTIMVSDSILGDVLLRITDETNIAKNGDKAAFEDINTDMTIDVLYSPVMTMSLPPQTAAVIIEIPADNEIVLAVDNEIEKEYVEFSGVIKEITEENMVIIDAEDSDMDIALIVNDDTAISHFKNKRLYKVEDLEEGMKITGKHSLMMTRSIPPQTAALEIIISE